MARPIKNACDYFPHDNGMRNHRKIKALRNKFTNNGYCFWCMFLEYLTGADGNVFENSDIELELLSGDFGFTVTEITEMLNFCIMIELLFRDGNFIYSESLNERLAPVYLKRGHAKEFSAKQKRINGKFVTESTDKTVVSVTETPQSKVKKIKVKNKEFTPPTLYAVENYFIKNGFDKTLAKKFFDGYSVNDWKDSNDKRIINWKQKAIQVWFKDKDKKPKTDRISVLDMTPEEQAKAQQESYDKFFE